MMAKPGLFSVSLLTDRHSLVGPPLLLQVHKASQSRSWTLSIPNQAKHPRLRPEMLLCHLRRCFLHLHAFLIVHQAMSDHTTRLPYHVS